MKRTSIVNSRRSRLGLNKRRNVASIYELLLPNLVHTFTAFRSKGLSVTAHKMRELSGLYFGPCCAWLLKLTAALVHSSVACLQQRFRSLYCTRLSGIEQILAMIVYKNRCTHALSLDLYLPRLYHSVREGIRVQWDE
jgi:hypothetical protein